MTTPARPFVRHLPKLLAQVAPAVLVATVGTLLLNGLSKTPVPQQDRAPNVIIAEAVFTATPRHQDEPVTSARADDAQSISSALARMVAKPRPSVAAMAPQPRKPANEPAPAPAPLAAVSQPMPIAPAPAPAGQPAAPSATENALMGTLRGATASLTRLPQRVAASMSGWFAEGEPPRPPAPVPLPQFQASM